MVVEEVVLTLTSDCHVVALDAGSTELDRQPFADRSGTVGLTGSGIARVEIHGTALVASFRWRVAFVERYGLIPGMSPADPGPLAGPTWLTATQWSPRTARASRPSSTGRPCRQAAPRRSWRRSVSRSAGS